MFIFGYVFKTVKVSDPIVTSFAILSWSVKLDTDANVTIPTLESVISSSRRRTTGESTVTL